MDRLSTDLGEARRAKRPWYDIADLMDQAIGRERGGDRISKVVATARDATGLSPQILKRHVALLGRVRAIAAERQLPIETLLSVGFNAQEVAVRLYALSETEGLATMRRLVAKQIGLAEVRNIYAKFGGTADSKRRHKTAIGRRAANAASVEAALRSRANELWGPGSVLRRRHQLRIVGGWPGFEIVGSDGEIVAGVDLLFPDGELNRDAIEERLGRSMLLAPYFKAFNVALPPDTDEASRSRVCDLLGWFGLAWTGVLWVKDDGSVDTIRRPQEGPVPDRSARYESLKRKFKKVRATR